MDALLTKGDNICDLLFLYLLKKRLFQQGSTLEGKNLNIWQQIFSFKA